MDGGELVGNPFEEQEEDKIAEIPDHVVVVISVDIEDAQEVVLYDPAFGDIPLLAGIDRFMDAWHDLENHIVKIGRAA